MPAPGLTRSDIAAIRVAMETEGLSKALAAYVKAYPVAVRKAVETVAFKIEAGIKKRTPVDTGRLRASFHTVVQGTHPGYAYQDKHWKWYDGTLDKVPSNDPFVVEAVVGTNVVYAEIIESGWSKKRPEGMVRVTIAEMRGQLEAAVAKAGEQ